MLGALGWIIIGAALFGALAIFWNEIRDWLNSTAANAVEQVLGYDARRTMQRAICTADKVMNLVRTRAVVYNKRNPLDTHMDRVTLEATAPQYQIDIEVLDKIEEENEIVQEFQYRR